MLWAVCMTPCFAVEGSTVSIPGSVASRQDALSCASVEGLWDLEPHAKLFQQSEVKKVFLGLFHHMADLLIPGVVLDNLITKLESYMATQSWDTQSRVKVEGQRCWSPSSPPGINPTASLGSSCTVWD